ncbi:MAG: RNA polymerase sigma factor [Caldilineaceae bacterium]|nr:RNA polymerase sigma factor [Caldilineaceae bacterium]
MDDIRMDDSQLVRLACTGDRGAFSVLLERHYARIFRMAVRLLGDVDDAEELAQDVCVALVAKLPSYRGESRFTTWLYRVVVNAAHDAVRRNHARCRKQRDYVEVRAIERDGQAVTAEELVWLRWALDQLSDELRATVVLVIDEGLPHAEAGEVLGVSESTVSWRMYEVRRRLRALAADDEEMVP